MSGMPPEPPENCDAHHIVPKNDARGQLGQYTDFARSILKECKINIDSAINGVFLPNKREGSKCKGSYHRDLHNENYYIQLSERLKAAREYGCGEVVNELKYLKIDLINGAL